MLLACFPGALAGAAALALTAGQTVAQSVRGEVTAAATQVALPYSTVVLAPAFAPRFSDGSGHFAFADVQPGVYRLTVKHIGYLPFDTVLTVVAGHEYLVRVSMRSLAVELPPVTVVAGRKCVAPGVPSREAEPLLAGIFDQLRENAARYRLLADEYPFRHWVVRLLQYRTGAFQADTIEYRSDARQRYAPGRLIRGSGPPYGTERSLTLPNIADLADDAFHKVHCFSFGGVEQVDDTPQLRIDFLAADRLRSPDVNGTAWLDSTTHQLRRLTLQLTRPQQAAHGIASLEVTALFGEILPALSIPSHVIAITTYQGNAGTAHEEQRFVRLEFLRAKPGGQ